MTFFDSWVPNTKPWKKKASADFGSGSTEVMIMALQKTAIIQFFHYFSPNPWRWWIKWSICLFAPDIIKKQVFFGIGRYICRFSQKTILLCYGIDVISLRRRRHEIDIIAATGDGEVFVWDYTTRELKNKICVHSSPVSGVCFVLSGDRVVTASEDGDVSVTDLSVLHSVSLYIKPGNILCFTRYWLVKYYSRKRVIAH